MALQIVMLQSLFTKNKPLYSKSIIYIATNDIWRLQLDLLELKFILRFLYMYGRERASEQVLYVATI